MRMEDLMPGCKVDIRITQLMEKEDVDATQGIYYTSIFDVTKDSIELQMPMVGGRLQLLPKNIRYEFIFSTPMGLYKAQGTVTDHIKKQHFYLLKIVLTSPLEKFQRREYYRITCMVPMIFMGVTEEAAMEGAIDAVREKMTAGSEMTVLRHRNHLRYQRRWRKVYIQQLFSQCKISPFRIPVAAGEQKNTFGHRCGCKSDRFQADRCQG